MVSPDVLTTEVSFRAASYQCHNLSDEDSNLHYETYLTYMYEKDLDQDNYWNALVATSTLEGIREKGKLVSFYVFQIGSSSYYNLLNVVCLCVCVCVCVC